MKYLKPLNINESVVYRDHLEDILKSLKKGTTVIIKKYGEIKNRTVLFDGFRNGAFWAKYQNQDNSSIYSTAENDIKIFPTKKVDIIKIGYNSVESKQEFTDRISTLKEIDIYKRKQEIRQNHIDAYRQSKMYPDLGSIDEVE